MRSYEMLALVGGLLALTACGSAPSPSPSITSSPTPSSLGGTFEQQVLNLTNQARAQARTCGADRFAATTPLMSDARLEQAAQRHAADMAARNYFNHTSQDGRTFVQRITAAGYTWRTVGENIAAGQTSPEEVVAAWLASEGHCRNIMSPSFQELGVGYARGGSYGHYWVQDFGAR
ncbi:CAP domain-containing protein [Deinococcus apachensis]|uniref:CAP domain-containing protein n=1 Tax=Deinococcus apachensis TaxID=309886 RepID=UPI000379E270|nr:CAP domain-containing protein [Deinococcus apachensis]